MPLSEGYCDSPIFRITPMLSLQQDYSLTTPICRLLLFITQSHTQTDCWLTHRLLPFFFRHSDYSHSHSDTQTTPILTQTTSTTPILTHTTLILTHTYRLLLLSHMLLQIFVNLNLQGVPKKRVILSKIPIIGLKRGLKIKVGSPFFWSSVCENGSSRSSLCENGSSRECLSVNGSSLSVWKRMGVVCVSISNQKH